LFVQNESYQKALWDTGTEILTHSIGVSDQNEDILTEEEFCSRLMKLRDEMFALQKCSCLCHDKGVVMMHFAPCCFVCEQCGSNIKFGRVQEHTRMCHRKT
jgi:hypothetical protein